MREWMDDNYKDPYFALTLNILLNCFPEGFGMEDVAPFIADVLPAVLCKVGSEERKVFHNWGMTNTCRYLRNKLNDMLNEREAKRLDEIGNSMISTSDAQTANDDFDFQSSCGKGLEIHEHSNNLNS